MTTSPSEDKTSSDLEWRRLLELIGRGCMGPVAVRRALALLPAETLAEANERAARAREALEALAGGAPLPAQRLEDAGDVLERLERGGVLSGEELLLIGKIGAAARALRTFIKQRAEAPHLRAALETDPSLDALTDTLETAIDGTGDVTDAASPELRRARERARHTKNELRSLLGRLVSRYGEALRDAFYTEYEGRYALPVRSDAPFRVEGIVLGSSGSGGTLYVEPREATEAGNQHRMALAEVERETARVLAELSSLARHDAPALRVAFEACVDADVLAAIARFGAATSSVVLDVEPEPVLDLIGMRHPLLLGGEADVVPNDVAIEKRKALVISGPNAGGKTVALKCLGLAAWMARAGLPLPVAPRSRIGWFHPVLTDIGDEQSIAKSLSTFSAHITRLASFLEGASEHALVLLDEVAAGTDPDEGAALAVAVLEALVGAGAAVAVTTHYDRLKHLAVDDPRFENASVGFDFTEMKPTFKLVLGRPGASSALAVAERFGIHHDVVARARELLPTTWTRREELIRELETQRAETEAAHREAARDRDEQARLLAELSAERRVVREKERARLAREAEAMLSDVREARAKLLQVSREIGRGGAADLASAERAVSDAARRVAVGSELDRAIRGSDVEAPLPPAKLEPGALVFVRSLGIEGRVVTAPDGRGRVQISAGKMKLTANATDLFLPGSKGRKPAPAAPKAPSPRRNDKKEEPIAAAPLRTSDNTCDLRGVRVEDVRDQLEAFIDAMLSRGESHGFVLHGHGTGAVRKAVREILPELPYVDEVRPASQDEGGDAFTFLGIGG